MPKRPFFCAQFHWNSALKILFQSSFSETGLKLISVSFEFWKINCTPVKSHFLSWNCCIKKFNLDMKTENILSITYEKCKTDQMLKLKLKKSSFLNFWNSKLSFFARSQIMLGNPVFFVAQKRMVSPIVQNVF